MNRLLALLSILALSCGSSSPREVPEPEAHPEPEPEAHPEPEPAAHPEPEPEAHPEPEPAAHPEPENAGERESETAALMTAETRGSATACAVVSISFDSRALPTRTTPDGFELWVRGQTDDVRRSAPAGVTPRMLMQPGSGTIHALFDGEAQADVLAQCERTVATYLPNAPTMPILAMGSAARVTMPCRPCD